MNRIIWVLVGAVLTLGLISGVGFVSAHYSSNSSQNQNITGLSELPSLEGMQSCGMHSNAGIGMHGNGMECMDLEVGEMDKNNDGICDSCGMSIKDCEKMDEMHEDSESMQGMHSRMHNLTENDGFEMQCGMH